MELKGLDVGWYTKTTDSMSTSSEAIDITPEMVKKQVRQLETQIDEVDELLAVDPGNQDLMSLRDELEEKIDSFDEALNRPHVDWMNTSMEWEARLHTRKSSSKRPESCVAISTPNTMVQTPELRQARQLPTISRDVFFTRCPQPTPTFKTAKHDKTSPGTHNLDTGNPNTLEAMIVDVLGQTVNLLSKSHLPVENINILREATQANHDDSQSSFRAIIEKLSGLEQKLDKLAGLEELNKLPGLDKKLDMILDLLGNATALDPRLPVKEKSARQIYEKEIMRLQARREERLRKKIHTDKRLPQFLDQAQANQGLNGETNHKQPSYRAKKDWSMGRSFWEDCQAFDDCNFNAVTDSGSRINAPHQFSFDAKSYPAFPKPNPGEALASATSLTSSSTLFYPDSSANKFWESTRNKLVPEMREERQPRVTSNATQGCNYKPASIEAAEDGDKGQHARVKTGQSVPMSAYDKAVFAELRAAAPPRPMARRNNKKHHQQKNKAQAYPGPLMECFPLLGNLENNMPGSVIPGVDLNSPSRQSNNESNTATDSLAVGVPEKKRYVAGIDYLASSKERKTADMFDRMRNLIIPELSDPVSGEKEYKGNSSVVEAVTGIPGPKVSKCTNTEELLQKDTDNSQKVSNNHDSGVKTGEADILEKYFDTVMRQTLCSRKAAAKTMKKQNGDTANAIMAVDAYMLEMSIDGVMKDTGCSRYMVVEALKKENSNG
ncbi:hypothetical protein EG328_003265 [Venturia inaequalis]|uniref:Uncharacterized protein n=1 Tax=Venturia inaequalis TaxID=5025 RepID=A0A8H3Z098_VENIN|nr:hypothetical protein EG328_003265 [Venturia inaequalis]KAE9992687.1 hypothetical protein EG327_008117 [Venturia inaequalis]RDI81240.1 Ubiquitin carboxyl-terminal hydrolase 14 [Venturia inaequalis]